MDEMKQSFGRFPSDFKDYLIPYQVADREI